MAYLNGKKILFSAMLNGSFKLPAIIDGSVTELSKEDFYGVENIAESALRNKENLLSVDIPDGVLTIGNYAFSNCLALKSVIIPDSVLTIGANAFYYNNGLDVVIGAGVTEIGARAFAVYGTGKTVNVNIKATTPPTIETSTFPTIDKNTVQITVPAGCGDVYKAATNWSAWADVITEESV